VDLVPGATATFRRAGHILGSAMITLELRDDAGTRRVTFSGDVGRYDAPILPDPTPLAETDYLLVESTYGNRTHDPTPIAEQLQRVLSAAIARGGMTVVPAFAIGRTQDLMYFLAQLEDAGRIPHVPVFIDSPLANSATEVYRRHPEDVDEETFS